MLLPGVNMEEAPRLLELAQEMRVAGVKFARPVREGQAVIHKVAVEGDYWSAFNRIVEHAAEIRYQRLLLFFDPLASICSASNNRRPADSGGSRPIFANATTQN